MHGHTSIKRHAVHTMVHNSQSITVWSRQMDKWNSSDQLIDMKCRVQNFLRYSVPLIWLRQFTVRGPGSSVGIGTGYGLDGPGIESRWERDFPHLSRPALEPTQPPIEWVSGLCRGKERPERDADPSSPSSAVVKKVELYLYSSYGPHGLYRASVPVPGCTLPLPSISQYGVLLKPAELVLNIR